MSVAIVNRLSVKSRTVIIKCIYAFFIVKHLNTTTQLNSQTAKENKMTSIAEHFPEWANCTIQSSEKEEAELAGIRALSVTNSTTDNAVVFFDDKGIEPVNIELTDGEFISKCFNPNNARTEKIDEDDCGTAILSDDSDGDVPELVDNSSDEEEGNNDIPPLVGNLGRE